jgi:hypothetical protein
MCSQVAPGLDSFDENEGESKAELEPKPIHSVCG